MLLNGPRWFTSSGYKQFTSRVREYLPTSTGYQEAERIRNYEKVMNLGRFAYSGKQAFGIDMHTL